MLSHVWSTLKTDKQKNKMIQNILSKLKKIGSIEKQAKKRMHSGLQK